MSFKFLILAFYVTDDYRYHERKTLSMSEFKKTQWHPPFCAAIKLELRANKKDLSFESEHTLNTKPIQIDLLVIKKLQDVNIQNEIGRIFKGHNIFEYKSPEDSLGIDEYFKTLAYACLYKANNSKEDGIKSSDITISLVRERMPRSLYGWLKSNNCILNERYPGVYYVSGEKILFQTQLVVSSRLNPNEHQWLMALTSRMNKTAGERLVLSARDLTEKDDKLNADSILQLAMAENKALFDRLKEGRDMCEALKELMRPEFEAAKAEAEREGLAKGLEKGLAEGRSEGINELSKAVKLLRTGSTAQELLNKGFAQDIVTSATALLNDIG